MENPESNELDEPFRFNPKNLDRTVIAMSLLEVFEELKKERPQGYELEKLDIIIDLHLFYAKGREKAKEAVYEMISRILNLNDGIKSSKRRFATTRDDIGIKKKKTELCNQYVFARLSIIDIYQLVTLNQRKKEESQGAPPIYRVWNDFKLQNHVNQSKSTIKADAAHASFKAYGHDIVWAVADSGIDAGHPHFKTHNNLKLPSNLKHHDFTTVDPVEIDDLEDLTDPFGHGTHVAGIIAGECVATEENPLFVKRRERNERGEVNMQPVPAEPGLTYTGMAPQCKLLSLKVLQDDGTGQVSDLIAAIGYIQKKNNHGRYLHIHGVNMSVGYEFKPEWFACGQSPLCIEVNRLVRSGVVVVVAAGNTGYGAVISQEKKAVSAGLSLTINDPGNAEYAITVGATHREMPHVYGVSYFSSKGPTGDGRLKPDIVAPGERIVSCSANTFTPGNPSEEYYHYLEKSGTSMAAPHVSGAIAAFLSIRREFINQPEKIKEILLSTATDLNREKYFQGKGLIDLMRAIQSV